MRRNVLHIYQNATEDSKDTIGIQSSNADELDTRRLEVVNQLCNLTPRINEVFPLYEGILLYLNFKGSLAARIVFYERLTTRLNEGNYSHIKTHDIDEKYITVVEDVVQSTEIEWINTEITPNSKLSELLSISLIVFFVDQLFSLVYKYRQGIPDKVDLVLFTSSGRSKNESAVINDLEISPVVVNSVRTTRWIRGYDTGYNPNTPIRPLNTFTSLNTLLKEFRHFGSLLKQAWSDEWKFERRLNQLLKTELGVNMPNSVHHASTIAINHSVKHILMFYLYQNAIEELDPDGVMVRGETPPNRFPQSIASDDDRSQFYLPHSILHGNEILPADGRTIHFLGGPFELEYLKRSPHGDRLPQLVPSGRPIHELMVNKTEYSQPCSNDGNLQILIATQPSIDDRFLDVVLDALEEVPVSADITVKIHPRESVEHYNQYMERSHPNSDITIETGEISEYLSVTDLTITVRSNVGLEAIFLGSAVISYNEWIPETAIPPYIKKGPVPQTHTSEELMELLENLSQTSIIELWKKQKQFVQDGYILSETVDRVTKRIELELED